MEKPKIHFEGQKYLCKKTNVAQYTYLLSFLMKSNNVISETTE